MACLIGSGAVSGAWEPVLTALRAGGSLVADPDAANCLMARVAYVARWACSPSFRRCGGTDGERGALMDVLRNHRTRIAAELRNAEGLGRFAVRSEFRSVIDKFVLNHEDAYAFITTNWDGTVGRALRGMNRRFETHYLHGRSTEGSELYLPTEAADEPYREEVRVNELMRAHDKLKRFVDRCTKLVIYGLALSPLDVEVAQMLASGMHESPSFREIVIVDPQHKLVASRLVTLLPLDGPPVEVVGYDPRDTRASVGVDYSIRRNTSIAGSSSGSPDDHRPGSKR